MDILREQTDEDYPMSADICKELDDRGVGAERKSIYANLEVLRQYNLDIVKTSTPKKGFFLGDREFEPVELRLIADAVQSASFISQANSRKLISKLEKNLSIYQRENFRNRCTSTSGTNRQRCHLLPDQRNGRGHRPEVPGEGHL